MRRHAAKVSILAALMLMPASPAPGQTPSPTSTRAEAMRKLDRWVGEWRGSGWSSISSGRTEFNVVETVQRKAGGTVLLVEGHGTAKAAGGDTVTHDGLTVVSYDDRTGRYRWQGHEVTSGSTDAEVKLVDGGLQWVIPAGNGTFVRFTIKIDGRHWAEVGEASTDGKAWMTFMDMTLDRVG